MESNIEIEKEDKSKELEERRRAEKKEEINTQLALSFFSGLIASMAPIALDVQTREWAVVFITLFGIAIWAVLNCRETLNKKIGIAILIILSVMAVLAICLTFCGTLCMKLN